MASFFFSFRCEGSFPIIDKNESNEQMRTPDTFSSGKVLFSLSLSSLLCHILNFVFFSQSLLPQAVYLLAHLLLLRKHFLSPVPPPYFAILSK